MYRKYYSLNDMPTPVYKEEKTPVHKKEENLPQKQGNKLFGGIESDDIILAVVVVMLLANDCDDKLLLLALAFVFFTGFNG